MTTVFKLFALFCVLAIAAPAHAEEDNGYICWAPKPISHYMQDAKAVFSGKVLRVVAVGSENNRLDTMRFNILFRVNTVWKGLEESPREVFVDTTALYRYDFKPGQEYLVIAYAAPNNRLHMPGCPRTRLVQDRAQQLADLGDPEKSLVKKHTVKTAQENGGGGNRPFKQPIPITDVAAPVRPELPNANAELVGPAVANEAMIGPMPAQAPADMPSEEPVVAAKEKAAAIPEAIDTSEEEETSQEKAPSIEEKPVREPEVKAVEEAAQPEPAKETPKKLPVKVKGEDWDNTAPVEPVFDAPASGAEEKQTPVQEPADAAHEVKEEPSSAEEKLPESKAEKADPAKQKNKPHEKAATPSKDGLPPLPPLPGQ